jgi:pimeloyl-ACP methyl ester carboxylesterase
LATLVDDQFLRQHRTSTYRGVKETGLRISSGNGWCFGLLYSQAEQRDPGFVICHSLGLEFTSLRRVERAVARALARLGHPVLTLHRRGDGDSSHQPADASLSWHIEDTGNAISWLSDRVGMERIGLVGARYGGLLAGLVAREGGVEQLILMNPVVRGEALLRQLIRDMNSVLAGSTQAVPARSVSDVLEEMRHEGTVDVLGYPLCRGLFEPLLNVDLTRDLGQFRGRALVLQAAKRETLTPDIQALCGGVETNGGTVKVELVLEPPGTKFGFVPFAAAGRSGVRQNVQQPMIDQIVEGVVRWMAN